MVAGTDGDEGNRAKPTKAGSTTRLESEKD